MLLSFRSCTATSEPWSLQRPSSQNCPWSRITIRSWIKLSIDLNTVCTTFANRRSGGWRDIPHIEQGGRNDTPRPLLHHRGLFSMERKSFYRPFRTILSASLQWVKILMRHKYWDLVWSPCRFKLYVFNDSSSFIAIIGRAFGRWGKSDGSPGKSNYPTSFCGIFPLALSLRIKTI